MRTCDQALVALVLLLGVVMVAGNSSPVAADSCTAQLGNPLTPTYYTSNGQIVVPVSATCSFAGGQLYAVGNAVDAFGANLGSTNTVLTSTNGGNVFNGQLVFTVPLSVQGNAVQISVSIYSNGPNSSFLTSVTQTLQGYYTNYSYPGYYWYYWYPSYPSYPSYPPYRSHHDWGSPPHYGGPPHHGGSTPPSTPPHPHH
jgi:hypothetical protein